MDHHSVAYVGFDTSKTKHAVAVAEGGREGEVRYLGEIEAAPAAVERLLGKLAGKYKTLHVCYEAGPTGYGLYRHIRALGHACDVIAPSLVPKRPGDHVKTNRRDAVTLARLLRAGELTAIWVPDEVHEAVRDLVRAREAAAQDLVLPQFACCWSCLGGIEDASTKEFEAGSAVHRPRQQLDPADLSLDAAGGPAQVERGLYGSDVLAQLGGKARKRRGARGGQHIIELLAALPSQKEGQPLCGRNRRSERGYLVQQPRHERSVDLGQRVGPTHQQAGHAAARRQSPSLSLIRGEHPAHVGLSLAPSCRPGLDGGVAAREALTRQLAPQSGSVAASLGPPPLQVIAVRIEHAATPRLAPGRNVAGPQPSPDRSAVGSEKPRDLAEGGARR